MFRFLKLPQQAHGCNPKPCDSYLKALDARVSTSIDVCWSEMEWNGMHPSKAEERSSLALYAAGTNTMHSLFLPLGCVIYRIRGQFLWNCFF